MFLMPKEIRDLSGYIQGKRQIAWLQENRIPYFVAKDGTPRVMEMHLQHKAATQKKRTSEPDEDALLKFMGVANGAA